MTQKAALYLRISQDPLNDGLAIERQREDCLKIVREKKWQIYDTYKDHSISAFDRSAKRPDYERMIEDFKAGKFDAVVCWDLDRLTRQPAQLEWWIEAAEKRGLLVVTANGEADLSTDNGRLFARIKAAVARGEQERKSARLKRADEQRRDTGRRVGGSRRQFGYERDVYELRGGKTVWVGPGKIIPDEGAAILDGYAQLFDGIPLAAIARSWTNDRKLFTTQTRQERTGHKGEPSPFAAYSVRTVLMNPRNAGIVTHRGAEIHTFERSDGTTAELKAVWEPIVSEETFRSAVAILKDPARRSTGGGGKYLLSGIARCGVAGCGARAHAGGAARRGVRGYRCAGSMGHFARKADPVDEYVSSAVIARLSRPDARGLLTTQGDDTKRLSREIVVLERRIEDIAGLVGDGTFTPAQARAATEKLRNQRASLEERIADASRTNVLGPLVGAPDVAAAWEAMDVNRRRAVVDLLINVTLYPVGRGTRAFRRETVEIDWKNQ